MKVWPSRSGATTGDAMIVLSVLVLGLSLILPFLRERTRRLALRETVTAVEAIRTAAIGHFGTNGDWPAAAEPGVEPPELAGASAAPSWASERRRLQWLQWEIVEEPEDFALDVPEVLNPAQANDSLGALLPQPTVHAIGGVAVHSADRTLLAGLVARYGRTSSFVRDTVWTLVLPERSGPR